MISGVIWVRMGVEWGRMERFGVKRSGAGTRIRTETKRLEISCATITQYPHFARRKNAAAKNFNKNNKRTKPYRKKLI